MGTQKGKFLQFFLYFLFAGKFIFFSDCTTKVKHQSHIIFSFPYAHGFKLRISMLKIIYKPYLSHVCLINDKSL